MSETLDRDPFIANLKEGLRHCGPKVKAMSDDFRRIISRHRPSVMEKLFFLALEAEATMRGASFEKDEATLTHAAMRALAADFFDKQPAIRERIAERKSRNF